MKQIVWYQRDEQGDWRQYFTLSDGSIYRGWNYKMDMSLIKCEIKMFGGRGDFYVMRYY